ncbi:type VI secretion system baseplate subunit TssE [Mesorhizobium sp. CAU 1741]|uniref:type VI secretion system baseplate subunit TssE n=1 Tax=Mesorhizobium sp. CAU 1741 TaxID=3140366 RepID=UPI00325B0FB0
MARSPANPPPRLSLFDRLLQGDSIETDRNAERAMRQVREGVRRDLEILFTTRPRYVSMPAELPELGKSMLSFGMPDLQTQQLATPAQQENFRRQLEQLIRRYEPRFNDVSVELVVGDGELDRTLRFRVNAVLITDSITEAISYDTLIDPVSGDLLLVGDR